MSPTASIAQVANEFLLEMCTYLPAKDTLRFSTTCKKFRTLIECYRQDGSRHPLRPIIAHSGAYMASEDDIRFTRKLNLTSSSSFENCTFDFDVPAMREAFRVDSAIADETAAEEGAIKDELKKQIFARTHCANVLYDRGVFRFGGRSKTQDRYRTCFRLDFLSRTVKPLPPMKSKRSACAAVLVGHRVYVLGGYDGQRELDTMQVLNVASGKWQVFDSDASAWVDDDERSGVDEERPQRAAEARMPFAICEHAAVAVRNRYVVVVGGCELRGQPNEKSTAAVHIFDTHTCKWDVLAPLPATRYLGCAIYREVAGQREIVHYGGNIIGQPQPPPRGRPVTSFVLSWTGDDDLAALKAAQWTTRVTGGYLALNPIIMQSNIDTAHTGVVVVNDLTLLSNDSDEWAIAVRDIGERSKMLTGLWCVQ